MDAQRDRLAPAAAGQAGRSGGIAAAARARLGGALRLLREPRAWSELATRLTARGRVHQDNSFTGQDRYPRLFAAARDLLADRPAPHLLSFGCSSGEEVQSLRRYFPDGRVTGAEVNRTLLRACRRLPPDPATRFIVSTPAVIAAAGPYDAIFCMAVLSRRPHEVERRAFRDIGRFYPYARFAEQVRSLADHLRPGGLLIVEHALYLVEDALAGLPLAPVASHGVWLAKGPRFDPWGALISPQPVIARIFRKAGA